MRFVSNISMKQLLLVSLVCWLTLTGLLQAQESPNLARLDISLWPEYDRPEVLVIYKGELDAGVSLPVSLEIALPARVGQPTAMAYRDENGALLNQQYTTRVDGDSVVVVFELAARRFQLEYYDALPVDDAGQRSYTFTYTADYPMTALSLDFQVPPTAMGFLLSPPADAVVDGAEGLTYHLVEVGELARGDSREWSFSYAKDNSVLTVASLAPAATSVLNTPVAAAGDGIGNSTTWIFLVSFVALIGVGLTGYWLGHRTQAASQVMQQPAPRKRRGSGRGDRNLWRPSDEKPRFCHQCGAELRSDSAFCHECGATVRGE